MRFASVVTIVAAVASAPLVAAATGPQMQSDAFLDAVRCAAYDSLPAFSEGDGLTPAQAQLNTEMHRQPAAVVARAHAEVYAVTQRASEDEGQLSLERAAACSSPGGLLASAGNGAV